MLDLYVILSPDFIMLNFSPLRWRQKLITAVHLRKGSLFSAPAGLLWAAAVVDEAAP